MIRRRASALRYTTLAVLCLCWTSDFYNCIPNLREKLLGNAYLRKSLDQGHPLRAAGRSASQKILLLL